MQRRLLEHAGFHPEDNQSFTVENYGDVNKAQVSQNTVTQNEKQKMRKQMSVNIQQLSNFIFLDVQDSVSFFSGLETEKIEPWINDIEKISKTVGWNNLQMYVYMPNNYLLGQLSFLLRV